MMFKPDFRRGYVCDVRVWALLIPAFAVLSTDIPVLMTLLYSLSAMLVVVAMAHTVRRVLMPYIDLDGLASKAAESPGGAGSVFLGVCLLIAAVVIAAALWIAR